MTQSPEPVDTFSLLRAHPDDPPNIRVLRIAVIGMGVALIVGLAAVIARIAYLSTHTPSHAITSAGSGTAAATASTGQFAAEVRLALPPGAKVRSQSLDGNRLAIHYETTTGEGILILDLETGRPLSQVRIEPS